MTSRPSFSNKRPLSAIFLGSSSSSSPNIPDLPEPPSPSASSTHSGLPSPPATNSTGSGSVGDSNNDGNIRQKSAQSHQNMINGNRHANRASSSSIVLDDVQDENELGDEEEQTARFGVGRRQPATSPPQDNISALERVRSLAKRNQEALEKLTGMSRLNTPSPVHGRSGSQARSPVPTGSTASSSSSSSSHVSTRSHSRMVSQPQAYRNSQSTLSGSETERENHHLSSSDERASPPSSVRHTRQRLVSAPDSPSKPRARDKDRRTSPTRPKKSALPAGSILNQSVDHDADDVTSAALAAVASSRRSPTDRKLRQPLPREFREKDRRSMDGQRPSDLITQHRNRNVKIIEARRSPSPRGSVYTSVNNTPASPRPLRTSLRFSTVRDSVQNRSLKSASDDISAHMYGDNSGEMSPSRQVRRGGSAESPLANGRSLVGEGLRAAGITKRREAPDDIFQESFKEPEDRSLLQSGASGSSISRDAWEGSQDYNRARHRARTRATLSLTHVSDIVDPPSDINPQTPAPAASRPYSRMQSRPATSMAGYHYDDSPDGHRLTMLRAQKTPFPRAERDLDQVSTRVAHERTYTSPYGVSRQSTSTPSSAHRERVSTGEHGRLMLESLSIFESHLSRLPPMGNTTTVTIPELFRSAQTIVQATERLNTLLRNGTNKALEEQIGAEVSGEFGEGNLEMSEHWRAVGSDFRDSLRVSDELVRNMTGFLLGVGKVLRETSSSIGGQQQHHMRSMSLDEAGADVTHTSGGRSSEGRSVAGSRRSLDHVRREPACRAPSREGVDSHRPPSALKDSSPTMANAASGPTPAVRRFLASRERDSPVAPVSRRATLETHESPHEPSPTPAPRQHTQSTRATLQSYTASRPLPSLPPLVVSSDPENSHRKKMSTNSTTTVRAGSFQPSVTIPSATTAITPHTVSFPQRSDSSNSIQGIAFSRPSGISVTALNGLKQRESKARTASTSYSSSEDQSAISSGNRAQVAGSTTAMEHERESRFRTVGSRAVHVSLDGAANGDYERPESQTMRLPSSSRRERRKTVTEIFAGN